MEIKITKEQAECLYNVYKAWYEAMKEVSDNL